MVISCPLFVGSINSTAGQLLHVASLTNQEPELTEVINGSNEAAIKLKSCSSSASNIQNIIIYNHKVNLLYRYRYSTVTTDTLQILYRYSTDTVQILQILYRYSTDTTDTVQILQILYRYSTDTTDTVQILQCSICTVSVVSVVSVLYQ